MSTCGQRHTNKSQGSLRWGVGGLKRRSSGSRERPSPKRPLRGLAVCCDHQPLAPIFPLQIHLGHCAALSLPPSSSPSVQWVWWIVSIEDRTLQTQTAASYNSHPASSSSWSPRIRFGSYFPLHFQPLHSFPRVPSPSSCCRSLTDESPVEGAC